MPGKECKKDKEKRFTGQKSQTKFLCSKCGLKAPRGKHLCKPRKISQ